MNIVKVLKKQIQAGNTIMLANGDVVKPEEISKALLKSYIAGVKSGEIAADKSFADYQKEKNADQLTVQEVIDFIENPDGAESADNE